MKRWYTRGTRPERNMAAAAIGALVGYLDATRKQKPLPGIYALAGGLGSAMAMAMNEHRTANRAAANERNHQLAMAVADVASHIAELRPPSQLR